MVREERERWKERDEERDGEKDKYCDRERHREGKRERERETESEGGREGGRERICPGGNLPSASLPEPFQAANSVPKKLQAILQLLEFGIFPHALEPFPRLPPRAIAA